MNKWISVEDELPFHGYGGGRKTVLVIHKYRCGDGDSMVDLAYCIDADFWIGIYEQKLHHITHWLPLPPFPKNNNLVDYTYPQPVDNSNLITIDDIPAAMKKR